MESNPYAPPKAPLVIERVAARSISAPVSFAIIAGLTGLVISVVWGAVLTPILLAAAFVGARSELSSPPAKFLLRIAGYRWWWRPMAVPAIEKPIDFAIIARKEIVTTALLLLLVVVMSATSERPANWLVRAWVFAHFISASLSADLSIRQLWNARAAVAS